MFSVVVARVEQDLLALSFLAYILHTKSIGNKLTHS